MMMYGRHFLKSHVLNWQRKVYSDWEDVTGLWVSDLATEKARLLAVDRLNGGTRRRLMPVKRSDARYGGALP